MSALKKQPDAENTRDLLIACGIQLFAQHGFDGTTIKDVCALAGVNISLVSYHFQGKEGLYKACIERFGQSGLSVAERLLKAPSTPEEFKLRLKMFFEELTNGLSEHPELFQIIQRECDSGLPVARDIFEKTLLRIVLTLNTFIAEAQKANIIRSDIDPTMVGVLLFSSLTQMSRGDNIGTDYFGFRFREAPFREQVIQTLISIYFDGLVPTK